MTDFNPPDGQAPESGVVVTRSEEELRIITRRRETQRARLIKYVEPEPQTSTVELRRERVRVEYEPISEGWRTGPAGVGAERGPVAGALRRGDRRADTVGCTRARAAGDSLGDRGS